MLKVSGLVRITKLKQRGARLVLEWVPASDYLLRYKIQELTPPTVHTNYFEKC